MLRKYRNFCIKLFACDDDGDCSDIFSEDPVDQDQVYEAGSVMQDKQDPSGNPDEQWVRMIMPQENTGKVIPNFYRYRIWLTSNCYVLLLL